MPAQLITPAEDEPVTLEEARQQLKLDLSTWDDKLTLLIAAARAYLEQNLRRALVLQTWELVESHFPSSSCVDFDLCGCNFHCVDKKQPQFSAIELPKGTLSSVTSVKYVDGAGVEQTLDPSVYSVDKVSVPGRVILAPGMSWPSIRTQWDAVKVRYDVGWPAENMPPALKQAVLLLVSQMWQNDVPEVAGTILAAVRFSFEALAGPYRIIKT